MLNERNWREHVLNRNAKHYGVNWLNLHRFKGIARGLRGRRHGLAYGSSGLESARRWAEETTTIGNTPPTTSRRLVSTASTQRFVPPPTLAPPTTRRHATDGGRPSTSSSAGTSSSSTSVATSSGYFSTTTGGSTVASTSLAFLPWTIGTLVLLALFFLLYFLVKKYIPK